VLFKGKSLITLTLKEQISAVQYDMESIPDVLNMSGTILCKVIIHIQNAKKKKITVKN